MNTVRMLNLNQCLYTTCKIRKSLVLLCRPVSMLFHIHQLQTQNKNQNYMKSLHVNAQTDISILPIWDICDYSCWKTKKIIRKWCDIFYHNFKNIPCYVTSEVSLKKVLFCFIWWLTYSKNFGSGVYWFLHSNSSCEIQCISLFFTTHAQWICYKQKIRQNYKIMQI